MKYKLKHHGKYDFSRAEYDEWFTLWYERETFFRKRKVWELCQEYSYHPDMHSRPVMGDLKWAKKIAKDLNIKLPKTAQSINKEKDNEI